VLLIRIMTTTITERQYNYLQIFLPKVKRKPLKYSYKSILEAIFFILRTGCQWRELPPHFPPWQTVYYHFRKLIKLDYWSKILNYINQLVRLKENLPKVDKLIIDSQSVKSTKTCGSRGIDGNKKVKGIKRHRLTDLNGFSEGSAITKASTGDRKGAIEIIEKEQDKLQQIKEIYYDQGYLGKSFTKKINKLIPATVTIVPRKAKELGFVPIANRWVIERTNAWCDDYRRLWKACERLDEINLAVVTISDTFRAVRRLTNGKTKRWINKGIRKKVNN
jgi:transposase